MMNRRRLLMTAAAGAGVAATGACAAMPGMGTGPTGPAVSDPATQAALNAYMDRTFEQILDESPESVTAFGLDSGPRAAAKSKRSIPTLAEEEKGRRLTREQRAALAAIDRSKLAAR